MAAQAAERRQSLGMLTRALVMTLVLLAAGCGGSTGEAVVGDSEVEVDGEPTRSPEPTPARQGEATTDEQQPQQEPDEPPMASRSPIGAYFVDDGGFEASLSEFRIQVFEQIARCMAEQGFEYRPPPVRVNTLMQQQTELSVREWTAKHGYGISTSFESLMSVQAGDPNAALLEELPEAERAIWEATLRGDQPVQQFGGLVGPGPLEQQGCIGQAVLEVGAGSVFEGIDRFGMEFQQAQAELQSRPEVVDAIEAWSTCMSDAGYPANTALMTPRDRIAAQFFAIVGRLNAALDPADPTIREAVAAGDLDALDGIEGFDLAEIEMIQSEELAIAMVDLDCAQAHVDPVYQPLLNDLEAGMLVTYAEEFEALRTIGDE